MRVGDVCENKGAAGTSDVRLVGIEVEVENVGSSYQNLPLLYPWTVVIDASLRNNGMEFVTKPIPYKSAGAAIRSLYKGWKYGWKATFRTGIHVHVDCRDMDEEELRALLVAYCLVEPALFEFVGADREQCIYCVPWYRAQSDLDKCSGFSGHKMDKIIGKSHPMGEGSGTGLVHRLCKYGALYLEPLCRYGTVEFRHAPTWDDADITEKWVQACASIVEYAKGKTPSAVYEHWQGGSSSFLQDVLGVDFPIPERYQEKADELDVEYLALKIIGIQVDDEAWTRIGSSVPGSTKKVKVLGGLHIQESMMQDFITAQNPEPPPAEWVSDPYEIIDDPDDMDDDYEDDEELL